jgi:uncharacterized protein (DUF58 family)
VEDHARDALNDRRCYFLKVPPRVEQVASYRRVPARRGELTFVAFRVATRFPFALFEKWRELVVEDSLLVYPALLRTELPSLSLHDQGDHQGNARGRGTETRELREFRSHDELRAVHWRRSAALGRLVVREFEREAGHLLSIRLDNYRADPGDEAWALDFERQVSRTAFLAEYALGRGYAVEVCARGERSQNVPAHAPADPIFRFLALIQPTNEAHDFAAPSAGGRLLEAGTLHSAPDGRDVA